MIRRLMDPQIRHSERLLDTGTCDESAQIIHHTHAVFTMQPPKRPLPSGSPIAEFRLNVEYFRKLEYLAQEALSKRRPDWGRGVRQVNEAESEECRVD